MGYSNDIVIGKIRQALNSTTYVSAFEKGKLTYNDVVYKIPQMRNNLKNNITKLR